MTFMKSGKTNETDNKSADGDFHLRALFKNREIKPMTHLVPRLLPSAILTLAIAFPGVSLAGDSKVLPGNNCKPASGQDATKVNYIGGAIFNMSNANMDVRCPIVRDITGNTDGLGGGNGGLYLRVIRGSGTAQNVTCIVRAYRALSMNTVDSSSQTLFVDSPRIFDLRLRRSEAGGPYEGSCNLPHGFAILNYQASE
jgi:hypothetical protein